MTEIKRRGLMYVMSSPSGAGKTTITRALLKNNEDVTISVSCTTRPRRAGEAHKQDYNFVSVDEFRNMVDNREMLEHAKVFDNYYGTPKAPVEAALESGKDVLFDIDWQGTQQLCEFAREDVVSVFVLPPSRKALEDRLRDRAKDTKETEEQIQHRMSKAADEMSHYMEYDYVIINKDVNKAIAKAQLILDAERLKRTRAKGLSGFVRGLISGL
ncbi:MAG TPA: guanylate kinase [Alphaproteobacteria bacterium]|jgi:guanylate kinase|nr:guanylate kinase [Micavibrio sp.]MBK9562407.1 guanylate kinase [Micavibrio sp.]HQX27864.1 guanylate kinase [Alphaproteobacteria bacterium]